MRHNHLCASEAETQALAASLAAQMKAPFTICLDGALGAGKSVFARGFLAALGVTGDIPSPTFTLVQTYDTARGAVWHVDAYRLEDPDEAIALGLVDAFDTSLCLIEWPGKIAQMLPQARLDIFLSRIDGKPEQRSITLESTAPVDFAL